MSEPQGERAKSALREVHRAAVRHRDDKLHEAAKELSAVACELGFDAGPVEEWRSCPVCGAEPGAACIRVPGHDMVGGMHPERTRE
ncbi:hypothetical protein [Micromonospora fulviviridis]|uniref:Uncharacterized protein n=1 Tax=Micromonospora fulviviridis TaxID=47860 RepID=A0ABV2VWK6_9ACTN